MEDKIYPLEATSKHFATKHVRAKTLNNAFNLRVTQPMKAQSPSSVPSLVTTHYARVKNCRIVSKHGDSSQAKKQKQKKVDTW